MQNAETSAGSLTAKTVFTSTFFIHHSAFVLLALLACALTANAADPLFRSWAATPPMGWNSWDCFATTVTEAQTKAQADFMAAQTQGSWLAIHRRGHPVV